MLAKLLRRGAHCLEAGADVVCTIDNPDLLTIEVCTGQDSDLRLLHPHIAGYHAQVRADAAKLVTRQSARPFACTFLWHSAPD
ncbi:MAG TPA: hypothetical protein VFN67_20285 [Polyangiales bacterium]|jgi:hypothetical protein|nr:hypothetical protein [Polyangiales bacterium]